MNFIVTAKNRLVNIKNHLDRIGYKISEDHLIKFDYKVILLLLFSFVFFSLLILFKIHGSSISIWNQMILDNNNNQNEGLVLGSPKVIRSDEWLVSTPFIISQNKEGFPVKNDNIGANNDPLLTNVPVKHVSTIFRPQHWGFFIFDIERAFSFYWNFKIFGLLISSFFLFMIITKNKFWLSIVGSLWIYLSGFVQWWFSIPLPEMITSLFVIFISLLYILFSKKKISIFVNSLILIIFGINFVLFFYPPFQIPLVYLLLFLLVGYFLRDYRANLKLFKKNLTLRIYAFFSVVIIFSAVLTNFYLDSKDTIVAIMNTVYPGKRVSIGGDMSIGRFFNGFYGNFLQQTKVPKIWNNVCEASNFILLFPIVLITAIRKKILRKKNDVLLIILLTYLIFFSLWIIIGFPLGFAKISLLSFVPAKRAILGIGLASIITIIVYLSEKDKRDKEKFSYFFIIILLAVIFIFSIYFGFILKNITEDFFRYRQILVVSILLSLASYFLLTKKKLLFSLLILIIILPGLWINPISLGLSPIFNKEISKFLVKNNGKWAVYDNFIVANFFKTGGVEVFNGTKYTPDLETMKIADPELKYEDVYNRYAHINLSMPNISNRDKVEFVLNYPDAYTIYIDPCSEKMKKIGIKNLAFSSEPEEDTLSCLTPLSDKPLNGIWVYKYE